MGAQTKELFCNWRFFPLLDWLELIYKRGYLLVLRSSRRMKQF